MTDGTAGFEMDLIAGGVVIAKARDVTLDTSATEIDVTTRDSRGWREFIQGLKEWGISVAQLWVPHHVGLETLESAYLHGDELIVSLRDPNGFGYDGRCIVSGMSKGEPLDDACTLDCTLKGTGGLDPVEGTS